MIARGFVVRRRDNPAWDVASAVTEGTLGDSRHLLARAKQDSRAVRPSENAKQLHEVNREIENIKSAVKLGKATGSLLEMLEDAERRKALLAHPEVSKHANVQARLERVLIELPERVQAYLENLETLLARDQVERGKDILASLGTEVVISPDGTAEIRGDMRKVLSLVDGLAGRMFTSVVASRGFEPAVLSLAAARLCGSGSRHAGGSLLQWGLSPPDRSRSLP